MKRSIIIASIFAALSFSIVGNAQPQAVDLGLSVKWASCNLGASNPEDYGDYYAWGEVKTKNKYRGNYKRNGIENLSLALEEDAAHVKLGGNWRIPTTNELHELIDNCKWELTSKHGVIGYLVTSNINKNCIFLPFASSINTSTVSGHAGKSRNGLDGYNSGHYWSSSACEQKPDYALELELPNPRVRIKQKYQGLPIRPVTD